VVPTSPPAPSPGRLAGQLRYLFEERPELRAATIDTLRDRLGLEDRYARARAQYPLATTAELDAHLDEFPDRIDHDLVREARALVGDGPPPEGQRRGPLGAAGDDTPGWLLAVAIAVLAAGLVAFVANLAVHGLGRATWTGGALLVLLGLAVTCAVWSHRHATSW